MLRTFIQVFAVALTLLSSGFWIRSVIVMRDNDIVNLSSTMVGYNLESAKNLCHQRADAIVAVVLLSMSAVCQMANLSWPMRIKDFGVDKRGIFLAILVFFVMWFAAAKISDSLYKSSYSKVEAILKAE